MLVSALYVVVCHLLELLVLLGRGDRAKELEILVLRHELLILQRRVGRPRFEAHDRMLLACGVRLFGPRELELIDSAVFAGGAQVCPYI